MKKIGILFVFCLLFSSINNENVEAQQSGEKKCPTGDMMICSSVASIPLVVWKGTGPITTELIVSNQ